MFWLCYRPVSDLGEVGALCSPQRRRTEPENNCGGEEGVVLGVELGGDVGGVAEDAHHHGPLHRHLLDQDGGDKHAGEGECSIYN